MKKKKVYKNLPYLKRNKEFNNKARHIAFNTSDILKERSHALYTDLQQGWVIDIGTSANMTPIRKDCNNIIYPTHRHI